MSRRSRSRPRLRPKALWSYSSLAIGAILALLLIVGTTIPPALVWIGVWSSLSFVLFGLDKRWAAADNARIPEITLHLSAWIGGGIGGLIGMLIWRHKTKHTIFWVSMIAAAALQSAILYWIMTTYA